MWRSNSYVAGKFVTAVAAVTVVSLSGGISVAQAETFTARWVALDLAGKQDRLAPIPSSEENAKIVIMNDTAARTTIVRKAESKPENRRDTPAPNVSGENARKQKLPVGCEPSFSPVVTPSMANVTGRCISALETPSMVAELSR